MQTDRHEQVWGDAERRVALELHQIRNVATDIQRGTSGLRWRGPAADRFQQQTERRLRELTDQSDALERLLTLIRRASSVGARP